MRKGWTLKIKGMTCDGCAVRVRTALEGAGAEVEQVDHRRGLARIRVDPSVPLPVLKAAVERAGYRVTGWTPVRENEARAPEPVRSVRTSKGGGTADYDLVIVGGGSAAFAAALRAHEHGARVAIINDGLPIGGTCVNVGCVPSKTLIRAAEALHRARSPRFPGIRTQVEAVDFAAILDHKRRLVAELRHEKYEQILDGLENVDFVTGHGRLVDSRTVAVGDRRVRGRAVLIATGARPAVPPIPGIEKVPYLTNEDLYEQETLPRSVVVLGGRYIALENAQWLARFGVQVTVLQRSDRILPHETPDLTDALTRYLAEDGIAIVTGVAVEKISGDSHEVRVHARVRGRRRVFTAERLFLATGRRGNTDGMGLADVGVAVDERGFLVVDETLQTTVPGVYGAGDVIGAPMFVYTAAYEGALAAENALAEEKKKRDYTALPWVIFTDPQLAGVGLDEVQARAQGLDVDVAVLPLERVPRAWAAHDTRGFIKLIRDRATDRLVGARILAPEGGELVMEAVLAIRYRIPVRDLAQTLHPYLTLSEGIKLAALAYEKDVTKLSCCAA